MSLAPFRSPSAMRAWSDTKRRDAKRIALVPTMGALHEGHLSLIRAAAKTSDEVVVSIFVNPTQFAPSEDLSTYPRDEKSDVQKARGAGATAFYCPTAESMYPRGFQTTVSVERLKLPLCGEHRTTHFDGVATVVTKLLGAVLPHQAIFGQKDYQQFILLRQMAADLDLGVDISAMPIVREPDGLALSSRNVFLNQSERVQATCLRRALLSAKDLYESGELSPDALLAAAKDEVRAQSLAALEYLTCLDAATLEPQATLDRPSLLALSVRFGSTRLIDNIILGE